MFKILKYTIVILMLSTFAYCAEVTLMWDANTEPDLAGYKVYYDEDSGVPYSGSGSPIRVWLNGHKPSDPEYADDLELDDNANPEFTVTGLDGTKDQYFAVTAYDNELPTALESDYSNEVTALPDGGGDLFFLPDGPSFMTSEAEGDNDFDTCLIEGALTCFLIGGLI